jgi:hypothetical protein
MLLLACDGGSRASSPTSPTPSAPPPTYTVSGVVSAVTPTGLAPLEGVLVEDANTRRNAATDQSGFYSISGLHARSTSISARKSGYVTDTKNLTISGDTRLDIQVVQLVAYTLSGVVSEITPTGQAPVEGVEVYCDGCGEFGHTWAYTDTNGFYSFAEVYPGVLPLLVRKAGYEVVDPISTFPDGTGRKDATVNGDTRFDIQLVRR